MKTDSIFNKAQLTLLNELSKEFSNLIVVIDPTENLRTEVYVATEFRHAEKDSTFNTLRGYKVITDIIAQNSIYTHNVNSLKTVLTSIDDLESSGSNKVREFSDKFLWIKL